MTSKNSNETSRKKKKKSLPFKIFLFWIFIYTPSTLLIDVLTDSREMYNLVKLIYFSIGVAYVVKNHNKDIVIEKSIEKNDSKKNNENAK